MINTKCNCMKCTIDWYLEAKGEYAEPTSDTGIGYDNLVFDDTGWSEMIPLNGERPAFLEDYDTVRFIRRGPGVVVHILEKAWEIHLAFQVKQRQPVDEDFILVLVNDDNMDAVYLGGFADGDEALAFAQKHHGDQMDDADLGSLVINRASATSLVERLTHLFMQIDE